MKKDAQHIITEWNAPVCSCGTDTVTCQKCGNLFCGSQTHWVDGIGNICSACYGKPYVNPATNTADFTDPDRNKLIQNKAYKVLLRIFNDKIAGGKPLDEVEKVAILSARQIPNKTPHLEHLCRCFLPSDFR